MVRQFSFCLLHSLCVYVCMRTCVHMYAETREDSQSDSGLDITRTGPLLGFVIV